MLFPYTNYLKYLLFLGRTPENIISHITDIGYIPPSTEYIQWFVSTKLEILTEANRLNEGKEVTAKNQEALAKKLGVDLLYRYKLGKLADSDKLKIDMDGCFNIVGDAHIRDIVEALLLRNLKPVDISACLSNSEIMSITGDAIEFYRLYFWDTVNIGRVDWKEYLDKISDKKEKYLKVLSLYKKADYIKWKMGLTTRVDYSSMLEDMLSGLYFKFSEMITSENTDTVIKAAKLADTAIKVGDKLQEVRKDTSTGFAAELQGQLEFLDETAPPLLEDSK